MMPTASAGALLYRVLPVTLVSPLTESSVAFVSKAPISAVPWPPFNTTMVPPALANWVTVLVQLVPTLPRVPAGAFGWS